MLNYFGAEDAGIYTCHGEENKSEKTLAHPYKLERGEPD